MPKTENILPSPTERFLRFLGLCRRAGQTVHGTPLVCLALAKKKPPCLVILSAGASAGTRKKVENKCSFYHVPLLLTEASPEEMAHAVGKTGVLAAVGVTDGNFARELCKIHAQGKESSGTREDHGENYAE